MREVKFRAWDKIDKKMVVVEKITFHHLHGTPQTINDYSATRFELMQYTGLKDENAKETYEGDIYRMDDEIGVFESIQDFYYSELSRYRVEGAEIIGNIYENAELLKNKDGLAS